MVYGKKWGLREALKKSEILKIEGTVPDLWVYKGLVVIGREGCADLWVKLNNLGYRKYFSMIFDVKRVFGGFFESAREV